MTSTMKNFIPFTLCFIILFLFREGASLRCRSGNQQMDAHFQKVLRTCRSRHAGSNNEEDSMSMDESSNSGSDSSSEENVYDKNFYYKKDDNRSYNQSMNNQRDNRNSDKNSNTNTYSSDRSINGNVRDSQNTRNNRRTNDRDSWNSRDTRMNSGNTRFNNSNGADRAQECVVQCFFSELHAVDQKGFPDKDLVIPLMSQNIQDPELKDFIEGSVSECFRYLEFKKQEKCEFSQNLLTCLAEKGQQNCEDWEN